MADINTIMQAFERALAPGLVAIEQRLEAVEDRIDAVEQRMRAVEDKIGAEDVATLKGDVGKLLHHFGLTSGGTP